MRVMLACFIALGLATPAMAKDVRNFFAPRLEGSRVDACLTAGGCGKPAADAFCRAQGYDRAMIFQRESFASTRRLDSGKICSDSCIAFRQIKCFTIKSNLAGL